MTELVSRQLVGAHFRFGGPMGERIDANVDNWLVRAPTANPGMLEMFRVRDREPVPQLVPWAGEFVGKYLISAIQARRLSRDTQLDATLRQVVSELISTQADDGYLGPFRKDERLLGHWDLWGHYHAMLALMMWYEDTGDGAALDCAESAADLVCTTYLDGERRMLDAGFPEMNLSVIHALGRLHRHTGSERYVRMMREVEEDWKKSGDYFRAGLAGVPFYKTPLPRWESLHGIQGLVELYRITGNQDYKTAFTNLWRSIARYDRHNTGGFSTGEQAIGNPYTPGAIETCCTTAWMALSVDMLHLTGDPTVADELELSTWNSMLGSQHPSGRWWTYNTPMDGRREASAHTIVFQSRAGTPELNCCSVNAPRGLGMLSEWALAVDDDGIFVNYYGPMTADLALMDGSRLRLEQTTVYPRDGQVRIHVTPSSPGEFSLRFRIPAWSKETSLLLNDERQSGVEAGGYFEIARTWHPGDVVELELDMSVRTWIGDGAASDKVSLYYGPLLLAFDSHWNSMDTVEIPPLDYGDLTWQRIQKDGRFSPIVSLRFRSESGEALDLCDFATAGAYGTHYVSWLPVVNAPPAGFELVEPEPGARVPSGPYRFRWSGPGHAIGKTYTFSIASDVRMQDVLVRHSDLTRTKCVMRESLGPGEYFWQVVAENDAGKQEATSGPRPLVVDASIPNPYAATPALLDYREDDLVTASPLDGDGTPEYGVLEESRNVNATDDRHGHPNSAVAFAGDGMLRYRIPEFPVGDLTFMAWVRPDAEPRAHISQVFSAWAKSGDDPLRVLIQGTELFVRIEGSGGANSRGVEVQFGEWIHVAVVKQAGEITLYVNGNPATRTGAPSRLLTSAVDFALGANPHYSGNEFLIGGMDDFAFYAKALSGDEIRAIYEDSKSVPSDNR